MPRRIYERAPLEQSLLFVDEARNVLSLVLPETAPEHEEVTACDGAGRIELQPDDPLDRREDPTAVRTLTLRAQQLRVDGKPARGAMADLEIAQVREPGGSRRRARGRGSVRSASRSPSQRRTSITKSPIAAKKGSITPRLT